MAELSLGTLEVELGADTSGLNKAEREVKKTSSTMEKSFKRVGSAIALAFSFEAARRITLATDALQVMERRLVRFTGSADSAEKTFKRLARTAGDVGSEIGAISSVFERFSLIRDDLGATNEQILIMTDNLAKLGVIGGSTSEETNRALVQLSQGLAGGVLRAEEFNSIIENTPEIAKAIGEQMGLSLGEMRKAMLDGELTSEKVFKAILDSTENVNDEFEKMPKSISMAAQALTNDLLVAFSKLDDSLGVTNAIAQAMGFLSFQIRSASGELTEQEQILQDIETTERAIFNTRQLLKNQRLEGTPREEELRKELEIMEQLLEADKARLRQARQGEQERTLEITRGQTLEGPAAPTSGELEKLAEQLELRFALTQEANLKLEAEELRHRAAILDTFEDGSREQREAFSDLNAWRLSEQQRVNQEEIEATSKQEMDKIAARQAGLNALGDLIAVGNDLISQGVEEGNNAAKAAFIAMKAIQVAQIIAATQVAAIQAAAFAAAGGPVPFFATAGAIETFGLAKAALVGGLAIGKVAGGRQLGGLSSPTMATPINEGGVPEIFEQSGKQFLLPNGKAGKVTPISEGMGEGMPNINIINNGPPVEVESVSMSRDEITMMINTQAKATENKINQSLASGRGDTFQALQKGSRVERRIR